MTIEGNTIINTGETGIKLGELARGSVLVENDLSGFDQDTWITYGG